eukprot:2895194-Amphidinium_carterae.1
MESSTPLLTATSLFGDVSAEAGVTETVREAFEIHLGGVAGEVTLSTLLELSIEDIEQALKEVE